LRRPVPRARRSAPQIPRPLVRGGTKQQTLAHHDDGIHAIALARKSTMEQLLENSSIMKSSTFKAD
jgi:hypothetical protein